MSHSDEQNVALAAVLRAASGRLRQPMRVAISGQLKRGKSVLVNALLGADVAPTSQLEATFTVGEFHSASRPQVVIHFRSDRKDLEVDPEEFRRYTVNDPEHMALLREIRRVEFGMPNAFLERFRLLDTPGLGSIYGADSDNTSDLLGIRGFLEAADAERVSQMLRIVGRTAEDLQRDTVEALDGADAVVYLFDRGLNARDLVAVGEFLGPRGPGLNAVKAIGVLSRCDQWYWPPIGVSGNPDPVTYDPLQVAARVIRRYSSGLETRLMFYDILPVAALAGIGAATLTEEEWNWLDDLKDVEPPSLASALEDVNRFVSAEVLGETTLGRQQRAQLVRRLGAWGLLRSAVYRRDGLGVVALTEQLAEESGVSKVRRTLLEHFGNRAALIKLGHALDAVAAQVTAARVSAARRGLSSDPAVDAVAAEIEAIRLDETGLAELHVLTSYYRGDLTFSSDEGVELLRVTGEEGRSVAARLGLPEDTPLARLEEEADTRAAVWAGREQDPILDWATGSAAREVSLSYGRLAVRARAARKLLLMEDDLLGSA